VLVLPSLLVVWTRLAGPDDVAGLGTDDDTPPDAAATTSSLAAAADDPVDTDGPRAVREITRSVAAPGERVTVRVVLTGTDGRTVVRERPPASTTAGEVTATPVAVDTATGPGGISVAWADGGSELTYTLTLPADADEGAEFDLDGRLVTATDQTTVVGDTTVTAVSDPFERIATTGDVTEHDLRDAHDRYESGDLSEGQLQRLHRAWVRGPGDASTESPADD
jgi:hypothetical protein